MRLRNWTPRYAEDKLLLKLFEKRNPGAPWLTAQMVEILRGWLKPTDTGIEWGAGRSTLWFAARLAHLTSVESDPVWHRKVESLLIQKQISNVTLHLKTKEQEYVRVAEELERGTLDFTLIDGGMVREKCALAAVPLLKSGGLLVVDNINWFLPSTSRSPASLKPGDNSRTDAPEWNRFTDLVGSWRHVWTTNGVTDTAMWVKP